MDPRLSYTTKTRDILTGPKLQVTWKPTGNTKGKPVTKQVAVKKNTFTFTSPKRLGTYNLSVTYGEHLLRTRSIKVVKPKAKKLPAQTQRNKRVQVKTVGIAAKKQVNVRFNPRGATPGKPLVRKAKVNKKGIAKVKAPARAGTYQVGVRSQGFVLCKATLRVR